MRLSRLLVLVITFVVLVSSTALAQDSQPIFNLDPEARASVMSEITPMEFRGLPEFVPAPSRDKVSPAETNSLNAAIQVQWMGPTNSGRVYYATYRVVGSPIYSEVQATRTIIKPDGTVISLGYPAVFNPQGENWWGQLWFGVFPSDWTEGLYTFRVVILVDGKETIVTHKVPVLMLPDPLTGPLEKVVSSGGSIFLTGVFTTDPVVVAPNTVGNILVPTEGGRFIPSSVGLEGDVVLSVCSGNPVVECSTMHVYISSTESAASRER